MFYTLFKYLLKTNQENSYNEKLIHIFVCSKDKIYNIYKILTSSRLFWSHYIHRHSKVKDNIFQLYIFTSVLKISTNHTITSLKRKSMINIFFNWQMKKTKYAEAVY